jgi:hypothetical protein
MALGDYILITFCLLNDLLADLRLQDVRQRGPCPLLHDSETAAVAGHTSILVGIRVYASFPLISLPVVS